MRKEIPIGMTLSLSEKFTIGISQNPYHSRESDLFLCIGFVHLEPCILSIHGKVKSCSPDSELFHGEENGGGNGGGFHEPWLGAEMWAHGLKIA